VNDWARMPGYVSHREGPEMPTVTIETARIREACEHARDELGFDVCVDVVATDYLGWGGKGVSGYIGTASGRDLMHPMTQGLQVLPELKPKRFSVSYHLLALRSGAARIAGRAGDARPKGGGAPRARLQCWVDESEHVPSVISVWPTCDWHEREQYDLMGIVFDGHPNLERLLMPEDWEGHPLRKDYPIGGEPVRFSDAE
jgi:NADH:ubiquinone oxidoreductase subunit C